MTSTQTPTEQRVELVAAISRQATLEGQLRAVAAVEDFDRSRREAADQAYSIDLANTRVEAAFTPVRVHEHHTASTDWLGQVEASSQYGGHEIVAQAALWFDRTSPELRADAAEFGEQAEGFIRRQASQYGEQAEALTQEGLSYLGFRWRREGASGLDQVQQTVDPNNSPKTTPLNPEVFDNFAEEVDPINAGVVGTETSERAPLLQEIEQMGNGSAAPEKPGGHSTSDDFSGGYSEVPIATPEQMAGRQAALYDDRTVALGAHHGTLDDFRREAASTLEQVQEVVDANNQPHTPDPLPEDVMFPWLISPNQSNGKGSGEKQASLEDGGDDPFSSAPEGAHTAAGGNGYATWSRDNADWHDVPDLMHEDDPGWSREDAEHAKALTEDEQPEYKGDLEVRPYSHPNKRAALQTEAGMRKVNDSFIERAKQMGPHYNAFKVDKDAADPNFPVTERTHYDLGYTHGMVGNGPEDRGLSSPHEHAAYLVGHGDGRDAADTAARLRSQEMGPTVDAMLAEGGLQTQATLVPGNSLNPKQKTNVLNAFPYRWTHENPQRKSAYGRCPDGNCDPNSPTVNTESAEGHNHPTMPLQHDSEWLASHAFHMNQRDELHGNHRHAEPYFGDNKQAALTRQADQWGNSDLVHAVPQPNVANTPATTVDPSKDGYEDGRQDALQGNKATFNDGRLHPGYAAGFAAGKEEAKAATPKDVPGSMGGSNERLGAKGDDAGLGVGHIWTNTKCPAYKSLDGKDCNCNAKTSGKHEPTRCENCGVPVLSNAQCTNCGTFNGKKASVKTSALFVRDDAEGNPDFVKGYAFASKWTSGQLVAQGSAAFEQGLFAGITDNPAAQADWVAAHLASAQRFPYLAQRIQAHAGYTDKLVARGVLVKNASDYPLECYSCGHKDKDGESFFGNDPHPNSRCCPKCGSEEVHHPDTAKNWSKKKGIKTAAVPKTRVRQDRLQGDKWQAQYHDPDVGNWFDIGDAKDSEEEARANEREHLERSGKTAGINTDLDTTSPHTSPDPGGQTPINGPGTVPPLAGQADPARGDGPSPYNGAEPYGHPVLPPQPSSAGPHTVNDVLGGPVDGNARATASATEFRRRVQANLLRSLNGQPLEED